MPSGDGIGRGTGTGPATYNGPTVLHPDLKAYFDLLERHGVPVRLADDLVRDPDHTGSPHADSRLLRELRVEGLAPVLEHRSPESSIGGDHATWSTVTALVRLGLVKSGTRFWDIGCGTGLMGIAAAELGAARVVGTDVDLEALELARSNADAAGAELVLYAGSLLDAIPDWEMADVVVANLPHKPRREEGELPLSQDGGPEGDRLTGAFFQQAARRLRPGTRVLFFLHSLAHPRLLAAASEHFTLTLVSWKRRFLTPGEYGALQTWFVERTARGESFVGDEDGQRFMVAGVWLAERR